MTRSNWTWRLLRPFTGTGAIFFPVGPPPSGTCEFSTPACREACYAIGCSHWDFDANVPESDKREVYRFVLGEDVDTVRAKIIDDLDGLQTDILHWFGSGDCPSEDVDKVSAVIDSLPRYVTQMGFTRNEVLWGRYKGIFALTVERPEDIGDRTGMFAVPNYEEEISVMHSPGRRIRGGYCGPITCRDVVESAVEHLVDCRVCRSMRVGCFDGREG